jgi:hypothetical protein
VQSKIDKTNKQTKQKTQQWKSTQYVHTIFLARIKPNYATMLALTLTNHMTQIAIRKPYQKKYFAENVRPHVRSNLSCLFCHFLHMGLMECPQNYYIGSRRSHLSSKLESPYLHTCIPVYLALCVYTSFRAFVEILSLGLS